jgi:hypothetical protein
MEIKSKLKRYYKKTLFEIRKNVPIQKYLPNTIIIGAQKSGTSSLSRYILQHPNACGGLNQETHFFDEHYNKGLKWYVNQFPLVGNKKVKLDCTPIYMYEKKCFDRIRNTLGNPKIIAILREPVDRTWSHYRHVRRGMGKKGEEDRALEKAIEDDISTVKSGRILGNGSYKDTYHSYVRRSLYEPQLKRFVNEYEKNVLIIKSKNLLRDPKYVMCKVFDFLNLNSVQITHQQVNSANYPKIDASIREKLQKFFYPYNKALYKLLDVEPLWEY